MMSSPATKEYDERPVRTVESTPEEHLPPTHRRAFALAKNAAARAVKRRTHVFKLIGRAYRKLARNEDVLGQVAADLRTLLHLARDWATRQYRVIPWRSMLFALAAIIYFVNPVDLLPDVLLAIGFVDDIAVISAVVTAIHRDLEQYRAWQTRQIPD